MRSTIRFPFSRLFAVERLTLTLRQIGASFALCYPALPAAHRITHPETSTQFDQERFGSHHRRVAGWHAGTFVNFALDLMNMHDSLERTLR
ncbi:hypothetical protein BCO19218_06288 [Burkholderia contaminans]|nr:hypothetical protein BCO19218_06288 [Burkholderia contaminans]